jgi:hypothetical protein
MIKKTSEEPMDADQDASYSSSRPVRLRGSQKKSVAASRSRKSRRKPVNAPGGIHQRANKRMTW